MNDKSGIFKMSFIKEWEAILRKSMTKRQLYLRDNKLFEPYLWNNIRMQNKSPKQLIFAWIMKRVFKFNFP